MKFRKAKSKKTYLSWFALGVFVCMSIFFTILTSTTGARLADFEKKAADLADENQILKSEVVELSSLKSIEEGAYTDGFVKPTKILYINGDSFVAKAR